MRKHGYAAIAATFALGFGALVTGCASSGSSSGTAFTVPAPPPSQTEYAIQAGDVLAIQFYYHKDHDQNDILVRTDGKILLPLVGEAQAAGLTPSQLSAELAKKYTSNLKDPQVSVSIKSVYQNLVWVGGEVNKPGFVQYRPGLTAVQALLDAGGPKDTAATDECVLLQKVGRQEYRSAKLNLAKVIYEGDIKADLVLGPKDVIFVPKTGIAKANVVVEQYFIKLIPIRFGYGF
jgi:protein involved in polysaccharide export with SLBB domain